MLQNKEPKMYHNNQYNNFAVEYLYITILQLCIPFNIYCLLQSIQLLYNLPFEYPYVNLLIQLFVV